MPIRQLTAKEEALEDPAVEPSDLGNVGRLALAGIKALGVAVPVAVGMFRVSHPMHGTYWAKDLEGAKKISQHMKDNTPDTAPYTIRPKITDLDKPKSVKKTPTEGAQFSGR